MYGLEELRRHDWDFSLRVRGLRAALWDLAMQWPTVRVERRCRCDRSSPVHWCDLSQHPNDRNEL
jgi:hypothetical protein